LQGLLNRGVGEGEWRGVGALQLEAFNASCRLAPLFNRHLVGAGLLAVVNDQVVSRGVFPEGNMASGDCCVKHHCVEAVADVPQAVTPVAEAEQVVVVAGLAKELVVAQAAQQGVVSIHPGQVVVAGTAVQQVVASVAKQTVITSQALKVIWEPSAQELFWVGAARADETQVSKSKGLVGFCKFQTLKDVTPVLLQCPEADLVCGVVAKGKPAVEAVKV
jgi:hypothetical protein